MNCFGGASKDENWIREFRGKLRFSWLDISQTIMSSHFSYYRNNEVQKFTYSRQISPPAPGTPGHKVGIQDNEFSTMWTERTVIVISDSFPGVMRWFPIMSQDTVSLFGLA